MKFERHWDDVADTYIITPIEENEFTDDDMRFHKPHPTNPLVDDWSWICPYCGKRVYSMEVHPCNQPYCGGYNG